MTGAWVVTVTYDLDQDLDAMDSWEDQLQDLDAMVARIPGRGMQITAHVADHLSIGDALSKVVDRVSAVVHAQPIGLEIVTQREHNRRADEPSMPELTSAAEIAETLGITRQRVHQLRRTTSFPSPLADLRGAAVWDAAAIRKFDREWTRKPGRPAKA